jgi:uncharacterized membrane protein (DUF2068 family)
MPNRSDRLLRLIGAFKLLKATLLIGLAVISFRFAGGASARHPPLRLTTHLIAWLGALPGHHHVLRVINRLLALTPGTAKALGIASIVFAAVFLVEGVGLSLRKRWAEWMTVGVTASFIPLEIYELVERFGPAKLVALLLNVAILVVLVRLRLKDRGSAGERREPARWSPRAG